MDQVAAEVLVYLSICCFELTSSSWIKDELKEPVVEVVTDSDTSIKVVGPVLNVGQESVSYPSIPWMRGRRCICAIVLLMDGVSGSRYCPDSEVEKEFCPIPAIDVLQNWSIWCVLGSMRCHSALSALHVDGIRGVPIANRGGGGGSAPE